MGIISKITGREWVSVKVGQREIALDPENLHHRAVAQGLDEADIKRNHPHLTGLCKDVQWRIFPR